MPCGGSTIGFNSMGALVKLSSTAVGALFGVEYVFDAVCFVYTSRRLIDRTTIAGTAATLMKTSMLSLPPMDLAVRSTSTVSYRWLLRLLRRLQLHLAWSYNFRVRLNSM